MSEDTRFDGLFMSAVQQSQGIENFYDHMFSFMRRKTDFFSMQDNSSKVVQKYFEKHKGLYDADKQRQELIKKKQEEVREKNKPKEVPKKEEGATVEEIDDEEARKIEELQELKKKQEIFKAKKKEEEDKGIKKERTEKDQEEESAVK